MSGPGAPVLLAWCLLALCLLAACGGDGPDWRDAAAAAERLHAEYPGPVTGGRFVESLLSDPHILMPTVSADSASSTINGLVYVSLLKYDKDLELVPYAAESYEVLDGGTRIRFKLREDVRWSDGEPLTAEDVEFTYKVMIDPETPTPYAESYKLVQSFRVIDQWRFEVTYEEPYARALISWAMAIVPKHLLEGADPLTSPYARDPVGAGPYKLEEWEPGSHLILTANEDYFEGRPYIDSVVYRIIPDQDTQFLELKAGNLDTMGLTPQQYRFQTDGPWWGAHFQRYEYLSSGYAYLGYNLRNPLFQDRRVRRALTHAIDRDELIKGVLLGLGQKTIGPYKPGTWPYNEDIQPYAYDPDLARRLLAEAGWEDHDGDGVLDRDGHAFAFTILTNQGNSRRIRTAIIIQERLRRIGISVKVRTVEWVAFLKEFLDKGRFDAIVMGWTIPPDPDGYNVWHSSKAFEGGLNFVHFKNAEVDRLLEEGRSTLDQARRKAIYDRLQVVLHEEQPYCFLYVPQSLPIVQARVRGIRPAPAGIGYNFERWWIPRPLQRYEAAPQ